MNEPAAFLAAMLNSLPLGFYSASQLLVQDAQRHHVEVRAVDVSYSDVLATLEDLPHTSAVRLGLRMISGMREESQFAALLRTLSKQQDRQVIIAVHEKPLFDYLS